MAGRDCDGGCEEGTWVARDISPGATIGFHAPYLDLADDGAFDGKTVKTAHRVALSQTARLMGFANERLVGVPRIPPRFLERALSVDPQHMLTIDTIGDAIQSSINLRLSGYPSKISDQQALHACDNLVIAHYANAYNAAYKADVGPLYSEIIGRKRKLVKKSSNGSATIFVVGDYPKSR
jgi:hypothetical protein